jgi:ribosome maturation factor RimP
VKLSDPLSAALTAKIRSKEPTPSTSPPPGPKKPLALEKLPKYLGSYVNLHLSHPYHGENIVEGELVSIENGMVRLTA